MYNNIEEVKKELEKLCTDYIDTLRLLKDTDIISEKTFEECTENKISFINE